MVIGQDLHLDVARMLQISLQVDIGAAERALRRPAAGFERRRELFGPLRDAHPNPAPAGCRLDHHRVTDPFRLAKGGAVVGERRRTGNHGNAGIAHSATGLDFVAHRSHAGCRRADEGQAVPGAHLGEGGVLGQKPIPGMDRVGALLARDPHQLLDIEIGPARRLAAQADALIGKVGMRGAGIGLRVDRDGRDPHLPAGPHHPEGDLAAVRDQYLGDASQSSSTLRWARRSRPPWRRPRARCRRRSPRCRSASSSPPGRRPRHPAGRGPRARP